MTSAAQHLLTPYDVALPRKRMASSVLFFDDEGRVLIVDPAYKERWELPGGAVEADESPHQAARREVAEELGLQPVVGRILGVDWVPPRPGRSEGLVTVFDGGTLTVEELASITVDATELHGWTLIAPAQSAAFLPPLQARRVVACAAARATERTVYLEDGAEIG